jgi:hypothetical protein
MTPWTAYCFAAVQRPTQPVLVVKLPEPLRPDRRPLECEV